MAEQIQSEDSIFICIFTGENVYLFRFFRMLFSKGTVDIQKVLAEVMAEQTRSYNMSSTNHYNDVMIGTIESQMTSPTIAYSMVYSGADQRKQQSPASLAFVRGIHR